MYFNLGADLGILKWWDCKNNARELSAHKKLKPRPFNENRTRLIAFGSFHINVQHEK
jgi:hypothetical protein